MLVHRKRSRLQAQSRVSLIAIGILLVSAGFAQSKPAGSFGTVNNGDIYASVQKGYLYFTCPRGKETTCRNEWTDLKSLAGKHEVAGFGSRFGTGMTVRKATDRPAAPDQYASNVGVVKLGSYSANPALPVVRVRHAAWDALFVMCSLAHAGALVLFPSVAVVGIGLWWNANTIAHNFIHRPFFRSPWANGLFSLHLSLLLGIPQSFWRARHLLHHGGQTRRVNQRTPSTLGT